jgi:hypothetical protein
MKSVERIERNEDSGIEAAGMRRRLRQELVRSRWWASHMIAMVFCRRGSSGLIRVPPRWQSVQHRLR